MQDGVPVLPHSRDSLFLLVSALALACGGPHGGSVDASDVGDAGRRSDAGASIVGDAGPDGAPNGDAGSATDAGPPACMPGERTGASGSTDGLPSGVSGVQFNVRTPADYDPTVPYPLIVTYAPSGGTAEFIESATGMTPTATGAGYVIAYVDTVSPTDIPSVRGVAGVADRIAATWCIDRDRTYLVGSSDGASTAWEIVLNDFMDPPPRAFAPASAGVSGALLASVDCRPEAISAMIMHNSGDTVFPMYGAQARDWLVACDECNPAGAPLPSGCVPYEGCRDGAEVLYCEGTGGHGHWPDLNDQIIAFFGRH